MAQHEAYDMTCKLMVEYSSTGALKFHEFVAHYLRTYEKASICLFLVIVTNEAHVKNMG